MNQNISDTVSSINKQCQLKYTPIDSDVKLIIPRQCVNGHNLDVELLIEYLNTHNFLTVEYFVSMPTTK